MNRFLAITFYLPVLFILNSQSSRSQSNDFSKIRIEKIWSTEQIFETPESVLYDPDRTMIYVSNISGSPLEKDGEGFISKLGVDGKIETLKWIEGLNAPKGMGIFNDQLYVTDLDQVVEISVTEGKIVRKYYSDEARFLNDIAVDNTGTVYVSDNIANKIFRLKDKELAPWLRSSDLKEPNGIFAEEECLLIGNNGFLLRVDLQTKKISPFIDDTDYIDGLVLFKNKSYLVSDFMGAVHIIQQGKDKIKILDTSSAEILAADIDFISEKNILLIPTFSNNRIVAYQILHVR